MGKTNQDPSVGVGGRGAAWRRVSKHAIASRAKTLFSQRDTCPLPGALPPPFLLVCDEQSDITPNKRDAYANSSGIGLQVKYRLSQSTSFWRALTLPYILEGLTKGTVLILSPRPTEF